MRLSFVLNDELQNLEVSPYASLLDILRGLPEIKSLHRSCDRGRCPSCLVLLGDQAVPSCMLKAFSLRERTVTTFEGLLINPGITDLEKGFLNANFSPCSYCAPSKAVLAEALLRQNITLNQQHILEAMPEEWCNCYSREAFVEAVISCGNLRRKKVVTRG